MIGPHWQLLPTLPYNRHPSFIQLTAPAATILTHDTGPARRRAT